MWNPDPLPRSSVAAQAVSAEERLNLFLVVHAVLESSLRDLHPGVNEAQIGEFAEALLQPSVRHLRAVTDVGKGRVFARLLDQVDRAEDVIVNLECRATPGHRQDCGESEDTKRPVGHGLPPSRGESPHTYLIVL